MDASFIKEALRRRHPPEAWVFLTEVRTRTGFAHGLWEEIASERYIDAFALNLWRSQGYERVGYEIKVTWGDLKHELAHPEKRAQAYLVTHRFYFAVPQALAEKDRTLQKDVFERANRVRRGTIWEKLGGAGLVVVREDGSSRIEWEAAKREAWPMPDTLIASLLRNLRGDVAKGLQTPVAHDEEVA
jgi:hypothetical protein